MRELSRSEREKEGMNTDNSSLTDIADALGGVLENVDCFYFIRHGQTDANLQGVMCGGNWDIDLNLNGIEQARKAANGPIRKLEEIATICSSPMKRARQTADILNQVLNAPIVTVDELAEWFVGDWERQPWGSIRDPFSEGNDPPGGETRKQFEWRVEIGLRKALQHRGPVLIVAHGGVLHGMTTPLGLERILIENCVLHKLYRTGADKTWHVSVLR